jgi:hypothetical protein
MQEIGVASSDGACFSSPNTNRTFIGALPDPGIGDIIYAGGSCVTPFDGDDLWYFVDSDSSAIHINASGVIIDKELC